MEKKPIRERRIDAVYHWYHTSSSTERKNLLVFLLAIIPKEYFKDIVDNFNIKVDWKTGT